MVRPSPFRVAIASIVLAAGVAGGWLWWPRPVAAPEPSVVNATPIVTPQPPPEPPKERKETVTLKRGDTLVKALANAGLDARAANEIATAMKKAGAELRRLKPGHELEIVWSPAGDPTTVSWQADPLLGYADDAGAARRDGAGHRGDVALAGAGRERRDAAARARPGEYVRVRLRLHRRHAPRRSLPPHRREALRRRHVRLLRQHPGRAI